MTDESIDSGPGAPGPDAGPLSPAEIYSSLTDRLAVENRMYDDAVQEPQYEQRLKEAFSAYQAAEQFTAGELVQWKPQLKNQRFPIYSAPAIVVEVFAEPWVTNRSGERMAEQFDVALGFLDGNGDLRVFPFNSKRFTRWLTN